MNDQGNSSRTRTVLSDMSMNDIADSSREEVQALLASHYSMGGEVTPLIEELTHLELTYSLLVEKIDLYEECRRLCLPPAEGSRMFMPALYRDVVNRGIELDSAAAEAIRRRGHLLVSAARQEAALRASRSPRSEVGRKKAQIRQSRPARACVGR